MRAIRPLLIPFFSAFAFAMALGLGGMTLPAKVMGFLDVLGTWDPSLAFFMAGAVLTYGIVYRWALARGKVPAAVVGPVDRRLVVGASIFGIGWGAAGYCPAPAIVSVAAGTPEAFTFFAGMALGIFGLRVFNMLVASDMRSRVSGDHVPQALAGSSQAGTPIAL